MLDLNRHLPSRWPDHIAPYASILKIARDQVRAEFGDALRQGLVTERFVIAEIKAHGMDILAGQIGPDIVDGMAAAKAFLALIQYLCNES